MNSPALERPALIGELADAFGVQCVVVGIDSLRDDDGEWRVRQYSGDPDADPRAAAPHAGLDRRSAGAGRRRDRAQLHGQRRRARAATTSSSCALRARSAGCRWWPPAAPATPAHFAAVFREADVDAALAASVFHSGELAIPALKRDLRGQGIEVRDASTGDA